MKKIAILIPTYKRFQDLINTLIKTQIRKYDRFIIIANLEDQELNYIKDKFGDKSIIVDERKYGKLGGCKAYNLAFKLAKENNFDYAILYADDIIPFKKNWLDIIYEGFIKSNGIFGIFCTDEMHPGTFGFNIILDCPIAHFFIIDCNLLTNLFLDKYNQYHIDFEISARLYQMGIDIQLLPVKLNHLRSGLHRNLMESNLHKDAETLVTDYPKYGPSFRENLDLYFVKAPKKNLSFSSINTSNFTPWENIKPKISLRLRLKNRTKVAIKNTARLFAKIKN